MMRILCAAIVFLGLCPASWGDSAVWKVSSGTRSFYLAGTMHMLREQDLPLPKEFDQAYRDSDELVFEVDMKEFSRPEFQARLMRAVMMEKEERLSDLLSQETFLLMAAACREFGLPVEFIERMQPSMAMTTLSIMKMKSLGFSESQGVDILLDTRARRDQKGIRGLETPENQVAFLARMGRGYEDEFVKKSLRDLQQVDKELPKLVEAWKKGDLKTMEEALLGQMKREFPRVYQELLVDRNENWMALLKLEMEDPETELVLVGALHLPGPDGLLEKLGALGYAVTPVTRDDEE